MPRDLESYDRHLTRTVANCAKQWIVVQYQSIHGDEFLVIPRMCKSNFCIACRAKNLRALRRLLIHTMLRDRWRLCTLTYPHEGHTVDEQIANTYTTFKKFIQRLRRKTHDLKYIRTLEIHADRHPHIHLVFNKYVPVALIRTHWQALGGGHIDIRATAKCKRCGYATTCQHITKKRKLSYKTAARYLTEEIEKRQQDPHTLGFDFWKHRCKTIATSRNVKLPKSTVQYRYINTYDNLADAMIFYEQLRDSQPPGKEKSVGWVNTGDLIKIGHAIHMPEDPPFDINSITTEDILSRPSVTV